MAFSVFPTTLDPRSSGDFTSSTVICLVYEGLTRCLPDGSVELALAEKVDISSDQKVYTFHLRKAFWTDGKKISAFDFERSWKQALDPSSPSICAYLFYPLLNGEKISQGKEKIENLGVQALSSTVLEVTLERPTPHFLSLTAFPSFLPVAQHHLEELQKPSLENRTVNGPFYIEQSTPLSKMILRKNPSFWNAKSIKIETIAIDIVPEENTALKMFEQGNIDWLGSALSPIPWDAIDSLQAAKKLSFYPIASSTFCTFNTQSYPFHNANIRKAFHWAIDREKIVKQALHAQIPATEFIAPTLWKEKKEPSPLFGFDPQKALAYFHKGCEELGISPEEFPAVVLNLRATHADKLLSQILEQDWKEVLKVKVVLQRKETKSLKALLQTKNYQMALTNWIAQYHDPFNILERFRSKRHSKNYAGWEDEEFKAVLHQIEETSDLENRHSLLLKAEKLLSDHTPVAPIYHSSAPTLCHPRVQNIQTTPSGGVLFERAWLLESIAN